MRPSVRHRAPSERGLLPGTRGRDGQQYPCNAHRDSRCAGHGPVLYGHASSHAVCRSPRDTLTPRSRDSQSYPARGWKNSKSGLTLSGYPDAGNVHPAIARGRAILWVPVCRPGRIGPPWWWAPRFWCPRIAPQGLVGPSPPVREAMVGPGRQRMRTRHGPMARRTDSLVGRPEKFFHDR